MHDACNDHGSTFRSDEFRLAGTLKYISHCNDYDTTSYRCNTTIYVMSNIHHRPLNVYRGMRVTIDVASIFHCLHCECFYTSATSRFHRVFIQAT